MRPRTNLGIARAPPRLRNPTIVRNQTSRRQASRSRTIDRSPINPRRIIVRRSHRRGQIVRRRRNRIIDRSRTSRRQTSRRQIRRSRIIGRSRIDRSPINPHRIIVRPSHRNAPHRLRVLRLRHQVSGRNRLRRQHRPALHRSSSSVHKRLRKRSGKKSRRSLRAIESFGNSGWQMGVQILGRPFLFETSVWT